ncbi:TlpA disulfide reductase family protein [Pedobacter sp. SYSU D00535]|uniref:TlpA family protein disulfide reductase n=1 Tax=Pedobacter sp. SYSU D00535 TaxID=2810308 RepID=UPI001A96127E|nr:TlpA disulfide reductase family protein [Pedobacter sp. SYSU D00535]
MKYIKSNIGFIISGTLLAIIALHPGAKSFVLEGLIKTGLYNPDFVEVSAKHAAKAPSAVFRSSKGEQINVAASKGKVIFLNFWAEWCPPCLAEMPSIHNLAQHFKNEKDLVFLLANVDGDLQSSQRFFEKNKYGLAVFVPDGSIPKQLFQGSLPTTIIVNKNGEIAYFHEGIADYGSTETKVFIQTLLSK